MSPALYLIDTSGLFRILQEQHRQAWADQLASGVIATCSIVELEFLYSARSRADRASLLACAFATFAPEAVIGGRGMAEPVGPAGLCYQGFKPCGKGRD